MRCADGASATGAGVNECLARFAPMIRSWEARLGWQANKFKRTGCLADQCLCCVLISSLQVQVGVYVYVQHLSASAAFLSCRDTAAAVAGHSPEPTEDLGRGYAIWGDVVH